MRNMLIICIAFITIILAGCSSVQPTPVPSLIIRDTTIYVVPPVIHDSGLATSKTDTLIQIIRTHNNDTITKIQYYPHESRFAWMVKPDTLPVSRRDTLLIAPPLVQVIETPWLSKVGIAALGVVGGLVALAGIWLFYLRKK